MTSKKNARLKTKIYLYMSKHVQNKVNYSSVITSMVRFCIHILIRKLTINNYVSKIFFLFHDYVYIFYILLLNLLIDAWHIVSSFSFFWRLTLSGIFTFFDTWKFLSRLFLSLTHDTLSAVFCPICYVCNVLLKRYEMLLAFIIFYF